MLGLVHPGWLVEQAAQIIRTLCCSFSHGAVSWSLRHTAAVTSASLKEISTQGRNSALGLLFSSAANPWGPDDEERPGV